MSFSEQTLTSASALAVQVMLSWTLAETFPMMQGGPRWAAHTFGVVRKTGGTGRITGCEAQRVNVNGFFVGMTKCTEVNLKMAELSTSKRKVS